MKTTTKESYLYSKTILSPPIKYRLPIDVVFVNKYLKKNVMMIFMRMANMVH